MTIHIYALISKILNVSGKSVTLGNSAKNCKLATFKCLVNYIYLEWYNSFFTVDYMADFYSFKDVNLLNRLVAFGRVVNHSKQLGRLLK